MKNYKVEVRFSGSVFFEIEAEDMTDAYDKAEVALNEMDEREIVANIDDVIPSGCEEIR